MPRIRRKSSVRNNAQVSFASSILDLDPEGSLGTELKLVRQIQRKHDKKSKVPSKSATLASIHEGWNKAQEEDANNNNAYSYPNSVADLLDFAKDEKVRKKSSLFVNDKKNGKAIGLSRSSSRMSTRTLGAKHDNFSDQMQQMFEKFGVPFDPPPLIKPNKRGKRRKSNDALPLQSEVKNQNNTLKRSKEKPFSNVEPKVDTRWKQMDVFRHAFKLSSQNLLSQESVKADSTKKSTKTTKSKLKIGERPSILKQRKSSILKTSETEVPVKKKISKAERLVINYPALETVKNEKNKNKLPLTIPPKYNSKKVQELTRETGVSVSDATAKTEKDDVDSLVSAPVKNSSKQENAVANYEQKRLRKRRFNIGDFLKGSLFDLKQFEKDESRIREKGDNNDMALRRHSTHMLRAPLSRTDSLQSSIQTQPSAFLTTKISIRRQLNQIPTLQCDDNVPSLPKVVFVETQEYCGHPMKLDMQRPLKRFPIPWKYPHNEIMSSKEKKAFPLTKKVRQRRNTYAFAYANRALSDDDGASSPINLLHRSSVAELDPPENTTVTKSLAAKRRKSSTQVVKVNSVVLSQRTSSSQVVNSILLNKKSSESVCSSGVRRSRSGSKHRIRFSEDNFTRGGNFTRGAKDFNGNNFRSKSQASLPRSGGSSTTSVSASSSKSSQKDSRQNSPVKSRSSVSFNKKRPTPVLKEFKRLQQSLSENDTDIDEVDLISPRSYHNVTEAISTVNDTLLQGIVDIVTTVTNLFTFSLFRHEGNAEPHLEQPTNSTSTTSTNETNSTI